MRGNTTAIRVQGSTDGTAWDTGYTLATYTYQGENGYLERLTSGNGSYETYIYDSCGALAAVEHCDANDNINYIEVFTWPATTALTLN